MNLKKLDRKGKIEILKGIFAGHGTISSFGDLIDKPVKQYSFKRVSPITRDETTIGKAFDFPKPDVLAFELFEDKSTGKTYTYHEIIKLAGKDKETLMWHQLTGPEYEFVGIEEIVIHTNFELSEANIESLTNDEKLSMFRVFQRINFSGKDHNSILFREPYKSAFEAYERLNKEFK